MKPTKPKSVPTNVATTANQAFKPNLAFNYLVIAIMLTGLILFYKLNINLWFKWGIILLSLVLASVTFFYLSPTGVQLHDYFHDSWLEANKIVWPSRKEATQFTWIVFLFVAILGVVLWAIDSGLSWLLYNIIF